MSERVVCLLYII